jgi:hypothetical protein
VLVHKGRVEEKVEEVGNDAGEDRKSKAIEVRRKQSAR